MQVFVMKNSQLDVTPNMTLNQVRLCESVLED